MTVEKNEFDFEPWGDVRALVLSDFEKDTLDIQDMCDAGYVYLRITEHGGSGCHEFALDVDDIPVVIRALEKLAEVAR